MANYKEYGMDFLV